MSMNTKRKGAQKGDHAFCPRIMTIIEKLETVAINMKVDYASSKKFEASNRDGMR